MLDDLVACFVDDSKHLHVRASLVVRQDVEKLPKNVERLAKAAAEEEGEPFDGMSPFVVFCFNFEDEDRPELYMGEGASTLMRGAVSAFSEKEALEGARDWCRPGYAEVEFEGLPGVYQEAFWMAILDQPPDLGSLAMLWLLDTSQLGAAHLVVREYPPKVNEESEGGMFRVFPAPIAAAWLDAARKQY